MAKKSAVEHANRQRQQANVEAEAHRIRSLEGRLDALAVWLAARGRFTRVLLAGLVAAALTAAIALLLFNVLFRLSPEQIQFGPITADNVVAVSLAFLAICGAALYWIGWRVLVGFDFADEPLVPGRAAAIWVAVGLLTLLIMFTASFLSVFDVVRAP